MSIKMIDSELAEKVISPLKIGEMLHYTKAGKQKCYALTNIHPYYVSVQGPVYKMVVPVQWIDTYIALEKEKNEMAKGPLPTTPGKPRGRPPGKTGPVAAPDSPAAGAKVLMAGGAPEGDNMGQAGAVDAPSTYTMPVDPWATHGDQNEPESAGPAGTGKPSLPPAKAEPLPSETRVSGAKQALHRGFSAPAKEMTIQQAEGSEDWASESLEDAFNVFKEHAKTIIESLQQEIADKANEIPIPPAQTGTCKQCVYADMEKGICTMFNITPPIFVVMDAEKVCPEFSNLDSDIPF